MSDTENGLPISGEDATNIDSGTGGASTSNDVQTGVTLKQVEELLDRKFQSFKDKRMGALEKQINSVSERLAKDLEKEGFDPDEVKQVTDRLRKPPEQKSDATPTLVPGTDEAAMPEMDKFLSEAGITEDDPEVVAFGQKTFANEEEKLKEAIHLFARRLNPTTVSPAATASPKGASIPPPDLREEYEKEKAKIQRGEDPRALLAIQKKYRDQGLEV